MESLRALIKIGRDNNNVYASRGIYVGPFQMRLQVYASRYRKPTVGRKWNGYITLWRGGRIAASLEVKP